MIVALIQARMGSSRLPGKVLMPLGGRPVLDHVVERCQRFADRVVVCTSEDADDDAIEGHCRGRGTLCVRGSREDVFGRFRAALADPRVPDSEWIVRATADCPLLSPELARFSLSHADERVDYVGVDPHGLPRGLAVEVVRRAVFEAIDPAVLDGPSREHVTLHLYENPERYRCLWLVPPAPFRAPDLRLTLDYPEDYALLDTLFEGRPDLDALEAIERLRREPHLALSNAACHQKAAR